MLDPAFGLSQLFISLDPVLIQQLFYDWSDPLNFLKVIRFIFVFIIFVLLIFIIFLLPDLIILHVRPIDQGLHSGGLQVRLARQNMLEAGFEGRPEARAALEAAHPVGRIAEPGEIARAIVSLSSEPFLFATGSTIWLDGGVLSRLYDPA